MVCERTARPGSSRTYENLTRTLTFSTAVPTICWRSAARRDPRRRGSRRAADLQQMVGTAVEKVSVLVRFSYVLEDPGLAVLSHTIPCETAAVHRDVHTGRQQLH